LTPLGTKCFSRNGENAILLRTEHPWRRSGCCARSTKVGDDAPLRRPFPGSVFFRLARTWYNPASYEMICRACRREHLETASRQRRTRNRMMNVDPPRGEWHELA
jgi:hypothetical protein